MSTLDGQVSFWDYENAYVKHGYTLKILVESRLEVLTDVKILLVEDGMMIEEQLKIQSLEKHSLRALQLFLFFSQVQFMLYCRWAMHYCRGE